MKKIFLIFGALLSLHSAGLVEAAFKKGQVYTEGSSTKKQIALTFDDGPGPNTEKFLDLLDRSNVKATFFLQGTQVKIRPQIAKSIATRGHEIASHTWQHLNYKKHLKELKNKNTPDPEATAKKDLIADMKKTWDLIERTTGVAPRICRMPHGIDGPWIRDAANEAGHALVNWTYGFDWSNSPAEKLIPGYLAALKPGAIILLHDGWAKSERSLAITEAIIKGAKERGLEIVTVGELLGLKP